MSSVALVGRTLFRTYTVDDGGVRLKRVSLGVATHDKRSRELYCCLASHGATLAAAAIDSKDSHAVDVASTTGVDQRHGLFGGSRRLKEL